MWPGAAELPYRKHRLRCVAGDEGVGSTAQTGPYAMPQQPGGAGDEGAGTTVTDRPDDGSREG